MDNIDDGDIEDLIIIDKRIDAAEDQISDLARESLRDRWEFGRIMLAARKGKKKLPNGYLDKRVEATGKSRSELKYRMQFAEQYTEDQLAKALANGESWTGIIESLVKSPPEPPEPVVQPKPKPEPVVTRPEPVVTPKPKPEPKPEVTPPKSKQPAAPARGKVNDPSVVAALEMWISMGHSGRKELVEFVEQRTGVLLSHGQLEPKVQELRAVRSADTTVYDWASLPSTLRGKEEVIRRAVYKEVKAEFEQRIAAEVKNRLDPLMAVTNQTYAESRRILDTRKGVMTKGDYNLIKSCLHPDSRFSVTDEKLAKAFRVFNEIEIALLDEANRPTTTTTIPSWDELKKRRGRK